jgi:hypothetical protein
MSIRSSLWRAGQTSRVSSFISESFLGCSILMSFSIGLTISALSPCLYCEEVSDRCADCLCSVWIIFFVDEVV